MPTKRTPAETWKALEDQADHDEMERILAMSPEELRRDLIAHGLDPDAEQAKADALFEKLRRGQSGPAPAPRPARREALRFAFAVAAVGALVVASAAALRSRHHAPVIAPIGPDIAPSAPPSASPPEQRPAAALDANVPRDVKPHK